MEESIEWKTIDMDVKVIVLGYLDYGSRCMLRLCSRDDNTLVKSTKYVPELFSIEEQRGIEGENSTILIRYDSFTIRLTEESNVTRMERMWSAEQPTHKEASRYDVAREIVERMMNGGKIRARRIQILNITFAPSDQWILKCDELQTRIIESRRLELWLNKTIPHLKRLEILDRGVENSIVDTPQVQKTRGFVSMSRDVMINDEQLGKIMAPSVVIISNDTLTLEGVKKALNKYVTKSNAGDEFQLRFTVCTQFLIPENHSVLFDKKWEIEKVEVDDVEEGFFCYKIVGGFENENGVHEFNNVQLFVFPFYVTINIRN